MPARAIRVRGIVQGVGFRPAIWRLAGQHRISGEVRNDGAGVIIHAYGSDADLNEFIRQIPLQLPPLARLDSLEQHSLEDLPEPDGFLIAASLDGEAKTPVAADAATCPECLADIFDPGNRRYRYPFTNCTHCGPRLSIIRRVPYDRCHTSMSEFAMCADCLQEYENPADRRFHAQANCCPACGPKLFLQQSNGESCDCPDPLVRAAELILDGHIVAIKGLGGFHLACNALDNDAVNRLRERKRRYAKPFALMARDLNIISRHALMNGEEIRALQHKAAPIVLLTANGEPLAANVAPNDDKLGFMLPYTPLHSLLLHNIDVPVVMTSGNVSDEPQCTGNEEAETKLAAIADYLLLHDRTIVNRLDDSVARSVDGGLRSLRRARGYSPEAMPLPPGFESAGRILAMGAELKNSFCLVKNGMAIVSQHIGDLENAAVQRDYRHAIDLYRQLYDFNPEIVAVDHHPGYLSTQYGHRLAETESAALVSIQHHHAHLAACLAEHRIPLATRPVLAAVFDGLGLGDNGGFWGGEFFLADYRSYTRLGHFQPVALPGGNQAIREPWRNAYAQLRHYFDWPQLLHNYRELEFMSALSAKPLSALDTMLEKNLNCPPSTSCGRWFDACAALLGLHADQVHYEGQAAIALEILATSCFASEQAYSNSWRIDTPGKMKILSWQGLWQAILNDLKNGEPKARIAARIHHSLIDAAAGLLETFSRQTGSDTVVLSGGVFQNRLLLEGLSERLRRAGKTVLSPANYPANDGGLSLGQAVIAAAQNIIIQPRIDTD